MKQALWFRLKWWQMAFEDSAERLEVLSQLPSDDRRSEVIAAALRESCIMAVMRVYGKSGDKSRDMVANDDPALEPFRDKLFAHAVDVLEVPDRVLIDLLDRIRTDRNNVIAHTSGKALQGLNRKIVRLGESSAVYVQWRVNQPVSPFDDDLFRRFCEVASDWLSSHLENESDDKGL